MSENIVTFTTADGNTTTVAAPTGYLLTEVAQLAGIEIGQPCGGQGRCGRCAVQVLSGQVRSRSSLRLSNEAQSQGYVLACQAVVEANASIFIPEQEKIERKLTTDRIAAEISVPAEYNFEYSQTIRRLNLRIKEPSMDDQSDDWSRIQTLIRQQHKIENISCTLSLLRRMGKLLRDSNWEVCLVVNQATFDSIEVLDVIPGFVDEDMPLYAAAIDIGTTTVSFWMVDLITGKVCSQVAEYNGQISRGEDVISRIIFSSKGNGSVELQKMIVDTINYLCQTACKRVKARPSDIIKATVAGNSTMIHLFLGIPAGSIRFSPFITLVNHPPIIHAHELGLNFCPDAIVDCLPGVASYVGSDITAGVLSSKIDLEDEITLFIDVGTNGEIVLGNRDWLVTCACSAGPAFEGAGVVNGMRATNGAIEEVWINNNTFEPNIRVIGGGKPKGICGSGLISLIAELFLTGVLDKGGNVNLTLPTNRVREGEHGAEYVLSWGSETETGKDISITRVDVDNLMRAKAAIYAGFSVLAEQVGMTLDNVEKMFIGGSFGKYINVEKAVQIGLLPDMPWSKFSFLGNTSIKGAYFTLLNADERQRIKDIANRMTYIELSADNTFYEAFTSALFLPHTDIAKFPTVHASFINQAN